jgi:hypothetical protein
MATKWPFRGPRSLQIRRSLRAGHVCCMVQIASAACRGEVDAALSSRRAAAVTSQGPLVFADPLGSPPHAAAWVARNLRGGFIGSGQPASARKPAGDTAMKPGTGIGFRSAPSFNRGDGPAMERLRPADTGFSAHRGTCFFQNRAQDWSPRRIIRRAMCIGHDPASLGCPTPSHKPAPPSRTARFASRGVS